MALTATAQSALPTWDETIVPALRKRLESESRILAKRMSIASVSSIDDSQRSSAPSPLPQPPCHLPEPRKSSAIPRPSLQSHRTPNDARSDASSSYTRVNGASRSPSMPRRARTYSQPPSPDGFANNPLPTPESSRPTSPRTSDVKPTRIPIAARSRTISTSSHAHNIAQRTESRNGRPCQPPTPDISQDHRFVKTTIEQPQPTAPPIASIRHQASNIINEPAPFATSSATSSIRSRTKEPTFHDPRSSNDSEERPFEHWYRGDVHRNGGVGELRVAKHVEMLQIANYGHNLRKATRGPTRDFSGYSDPSRMRKRADSVGIGTHESFYLDDEPAKDADMVLDETPLTDLEADHDTETETFYDAYAGLDTEADADDTIHSSFSAFSPDRPFAVVSSNRSQTPTSVRPIPHGNITPKDVTQALAVDDPLRSSTSSAPVRSSAESNVPAPSASGLYARTPRAISPTSQLSEHSYTKRRAKSPAASSTASTPKRARTAAKTPPLTSRKDDPRISIATYPTPEGDVVDAIPTWTQPVQKAGNWDEVVLPVVARKRGLDGQYEQVHGSPRPKTPEAPIKPAPGTFGYDYTKYQSPRASEDVQMSEFGRFPANSPLPEEDEEPIHTGTPPKLVIQPIIVKVEEPRLEDPRKTVPRPPDSPLPFSHYRVDQQVPTISVQRPSFDADRRQEQDDEDANAGCCKCVIM